MKNFLLILWISLNVFGFAQNQNSVEGAYLSKDGDTFQLWLLVDGYSSMTTFNDKEYISSIGGTYQFENNQITVSVEFNDQNNSEVGTKKTYNLSFNNGNFKDENGKVWVKQNKAQSLDGTWKISARMMDGKMTEIHQKGERKTLKLLIGGYFQWFAINPSEKSFSGTGGGTYTFENGKYTENIQFFSRDNSRVGASLSFDGELKNGEWHHSGLSSKGEPIHEIWKRIQ